MLRVITSALPKTPLVENFRTHLISFQIHCLYTHCWAVTLLMVSWNGKFIAKKVAYHPFSLDTINLMHSLVISSENKWSKYHTEHLICQKLPQIPTWKSSGSKHCNHIPKFIFTNINERPRTVFAVQKRSITGKTHLCPHFKIFWKARLSFFDQYKVIESMCHHYPFFLLWLNTCL